VIYHRPSGKTHLLNEAGYRLLTELLLEPKDLATIAAEYDPGHQMTSSGDYLQRMRQMLRRLEQFGLIERE
jgi:PqqD family protein of HPr-rel-A system